MTITSVFVYGTLQRGECRADQWPCPPRHVQPARLRGQLFDLGPYPALIEGKDWVAGECWRLESDDVQPTLRVLDAIEGYGQAGDDLYVRRIETCWNEVGQSIQAYTYYYGDPAQLMRIARRVPANAQGLCVWRRGDQPPDWPRRPP